MKVTKYELPDADLSYYANFFTEKESTEYYALLLNEIAWRQDDIKVFGKVYKQPRLTALYADNQKPYSYSNITMFPEQFNNTLIKLKNKIEENSGHLFTTCLLNLYRDGNDSNGWHADNEKELGKNPVIASLSFGQARFFHLKHRTDKSQRLKILLESGSLLLMQGSTQHYWLHQIAKTKRKVKPRINLTFRYIK